MADTWWTNPSELDEKQKAVIALPADGHNLVVGPPGCGKTNLLLLRASYLHASGLKNIVVLTFARSLREFLASGASNYSFASDKIQTYVRWGNGVLAENGVSQTQGKGFEETRAGLLDGLRSVADLALPQNQFDCILLDEAQDYTSAELEVLLNFTPRLFAVGDRNQRIQSEDADALQFLEEHGIGLTTLKYHYRNGLKICRVADGIHGLVDHADGMEATSNYDEAAYPSTVQCFGELSLDEQIEKALDAIPDQLTAYSDEYIGVLCPRKEELDAVGEALLASTIGDQVHVQHGDYESLSTDRRVVVTTIHGAKGLEFRAGHIISADLVKKFRLQKKMAYTAVTRCKTSLAVYHQNDLPGYFENGLQACSGPTKEPNLDDLFGGGAA